MPLFRQPPQTQQQLRGSRSLVPAAPTGTAYVAYASDIAMLHFRFASFDGSGQVNGIAFDSGAGTWSGDPEITMANGVAVTSAAFKFVGSSISNVGRFSIDIGGFSTVLESRFALNFRRLDSANRWEVAVFRSADGSFRRVTLKKVVAGVATDLIDIDPGAIDPVARHTVAVQVGGFGGSTNDIGMYFDGVQIGAIQNDSAHSSRVIAGFSFDNNGQGWVDNFIHASLQQVEEGQTAERTVGHPRAASDSIAIGSDAPGQTVGRGRAVTDTVTTSDSIARSAGYAREIADTTSMSESVARARGQARTATDTTSMSESITRLLTASRAPPDTTSVSDSIARVRGQSRTATDTTTLSESVGHVYTPVSTGYNRTAADSVTTSDSPARRLGASRAHADTTSVSDAVTRVRGQARTATDTTSVSDSVARSKGNPRALADTVSTTESAARQLAASRAASDTTAVSDAVGDVLSLSRTLADTVTTTDGLVALRRGPTQFLRPEADLAGNWHAEDARTTNLYTSVDDSPFDDATYVESPDSPTSADFEEFALPDAADPEIGTGHIVRYRYGGDSDLVVELRQGATVIASWTHSTPGTGPFLATQTLSEAEADSITDYTDLRIRVRGAG